MKAKFFLIFIFFWGLSYFGYSQSDIVDSCYSKSEQLPCGKLLKQYSQVWKADSFANNGARKYVGKQVFAKCDCFAGIKWMEISEYFGKANFEIDGAKFGYPGQKMYRYIIYASDKLENYQNPGSIRLDIVVFEGRILYFNVFESDG